ncbi:hypothetical protein BD413DRAFT_591440 [Trametes elegans]|nr:hypothetical protein BD413DRAFT_599869 [Trametes elegans]KAI0761291.1 hypothetical protein BD413DRAFT_591440 [Trametes elegans]
MASERPSASSSSSAAPSSTTSQAAASNGGASALMGSSSLPFSFLITFIAIFLFFLGCGLGSRRVTRQLRRNLALQITPAPTARIAPVREKPILWDVYPGELPLPVILKDGGVRPPAYRYAWENLSPLSAAYIRASADAKKSSASVNPEPEPPPMLRWASSLRPHRSMMRTLAATPSLARPLPPHTATELSRSPPRRTPRSEPEVRWRGHRLPQFLARPLLPPTMQRPTVVYGTEDTVPEEKEPVKAIQVAVLIAMPSPEHARARRVLLDSGKVDAEVEELEVSAGDGLGDYVLGLGRLPWEGEVDGAAGDGSKQEASV